MADLSATEGKRRSQGGQQPTRESRGRQRTGRKTETLVGGRETSGPEGPKAGDDVPGSAMRGTAEQRRGPWEKRHRPCQQKRAARQAAGCLREAMPAAFRPRFSAARDAKSLASSSPPPACGAPPQSWHSATSSSNPQHPATEAAGLAAAPRLAHAVKDLCPRTAGVLRSVEEVRRRSEFAEAAASSLPAAADRDVTPTFAAPGGCGCARWKEVAYVRFLGRREEVRVEMWRAASGDHGRTCSRSALAGWL